MRGRKRADLNLHRGRRACIVALLLLAACAETAPRTDSVSVAAPPSQTVAPTAEGIAALQRKDYAGAVRILTANAERGDAAAQAHLGLMNERGEGVPQNYAGALAWYRKAAAQGDALAQYHLGSFFEQGRSVFKDLASAVLWYRKAAEQGLAGAQARLGGLYSRGGSGVLVDYREAMLWLRKAAEQGSAAGQSGLGELYISGYGVTKNEAEAVRWFRLAAAQDDVHAEARLGFMMLRGIAMPKDTIEAARLLNKSARGGSVGALYLLGHLAEVGEGQPKNLTEAYLWYDLAAASGNHQATLKRNAVGRALSPAELGQAQARAAAWKPDVGASLAEATALLPQSGLSRAAAGSGIVIGRTGEVLTARHVVQGCTELRIAGGATAASAVEHASADIALLRFASSPSVAPAALRDPADMRQGEAVAVVGFPYANALAPGTTVTAGVISTLTGPAGDRTFIQISAPVQPGNSGGPVLDAQGNLVGIVSSALNVAKLVPVTGLLPQNINFAVAGGVAKSFLDANGVAYETARLTRAMSTADVAAQAQRYTVKLECWK